MRFFNNLLGKKNKKVEQASSPSEHAVLVHFFYGSLDLSRLFDLENQLVEVITSAGVGEYDGNEVASDGSEGTLYLYGPDADALFAAVRPTLEAVDFMHGARVQLRFGPPVDGVRKVEVVIGT
jgi:hypothetical protein